MWLFRKGVDISRFSPRTVTADDLHPVARLLRDGVRRHHGLGGDSLPALLSGGHGVVLDAGDELYGVALVSTPTGATCWLRAVALADAVELNAAMSLLIAALHRVLLARGIRQIFFAGDEVADDWLTTALQAHGYLSDTEVLVYEKSHLDIPDQGNPAVQVRPATDVDLPSVMRVDQECFEPQWTKGDALLGPALEQGPYFVVAELDHELVGYAYATTHFAGRLVHLVRIAVAPQHRGARIGVRLLADLVAFAAEQQASTLTLNTQAYNLSAQRLYRWFGFTPTGERQVVFRCDL